MKRNLLFHLYPKKESIWRWHVDRLLEYRSAWNGRRIITVVMDKETESKAVVTEALERLDAEVSFERNDRELGETRLFIETLGRLESRDPDEATFYAHAKGVTRTGKQVDAIRDWCRAMYILNLESIPSIERLLQKYPAIGCFRHAIKHGGSSWCYAGTFFWLKHRDLFMRNWRRIEKSLYGVEGYPGMHFRWGEMGRLTQDNVGPQWLYNNGSVTDAKISEWKKYWRDDMHPSAMDFLRRALTEFEVTKKTVLEVGSYNVNGTPRTVVDKLGPKSYLGVDSQTGPCVDRVVSVNDLVKEFGEDRFDVVISTEMMEHVKEWRKAVMQLKAVTKPGGLLVITTRSPGFPYHPYPEDHWRFTIDQFKKIFADMEIVTLESDIPTFPGVFLKARKIAGAPLLPIESLQAINPFGPK